MNQPTRVWVKAWIPRDTVALEKRQHIAMFGGVSTVVLGLFNPECCSPPWLYISLVSQITLWFFNQLDFGSIFQVPFEMKYNHGKCWHVGTDMLQKFPNWYNARQRVRRVISCRSLNSTRCVVICEFASRFYKSDTLPCSSNSSSGSILDTSSKRIWSEWMTNLHYIIFDSVRDAVVLTTQVFSVAYCHL